mgnify:CR=1 FL=1
MLCWAEELPPLFCFCVVLFHTCFVRGRRVWVDVIRFVLGWWWWHCIVARSLCVSALTLPHCSVVAALVVYQIVYEATIDDMPFIDALQQSLTSNLLWLAIGLFDTIVRYLFLVRGRGDVKRDTRAS